MFHWGKKNPLLLFIMLNINALALIQEFPLNQNSGDIFLIRSVFVIVFIIYFDV